jgi:hypothetical protein
MGHITIPTNSSSLYEYVAPHILSVDDAKPHELFGKVKVFVNGCWVGIAKSPIAFYLGLCQDLGVDVVPYPAPVVNAMRSMGQPFFNPPNVRGWIYGRNWISSTTLAARRSVARSLFNPVNEERLNADEQEALKTARAAGRGNYVVTPDRLEYLAKNRTDAEIVQHLCNYFLPAPVSPEFRKVLESHLKPDKMRVRSMQEAIVAILQAPLYQLS